MIFNKVAYSQAILRRLHEKNAGIPTSVIVGAGVAGGAHTLHKGLQNAQGYQAGFTPGTYPQGK